MKSLTDGREISLEELLESRDRRFAFQQELLSRFKLPLISFMANIPGPVKKSSLSEEIFEAGLAAVRKAFAESIRFEEVRRPDTGCEGFFVVDLVPEQVKRRTCTLEDGSPLGRLWDFDVHCPSYAPDAERNCRACADWCTFAENLRCAGTQISRRQLGLPERRCLICGGPAPECARSRRHSVAELLAKISALSEIVEIL